MSKGDNLFGIKTIYKGIELRSKLESKFCMFLDALNIKWVYEPKLFLLSNGIMYKPDFFLPELNLWIEVKGLIQDNNREISKDFVKENNTPLLLISSNSFEFYDIWTADNSNEVYVDKDILVGKCSNCCKYFLCTSAGSYDCTACGNYEGDHDITGSLGCFLDDDIDFSDIESIKGWLNKHGISI